MPLTAMDLVAQAKQHIQEVNQSEALALLGQVPVLDVREPGEYAQGCLPGAVNIPRGVLEFQIGNHPKFQGGQGAEILVYCLSGGRSALAVEALKKLGYDKAVSLAGGYKAWQEAGQPVAQPGS
ncbi:Rhodanese-related sulfurtransferase [Methylomagnum ishizawai]|uniref:Rhodanese-related sulfurtransferase n=1 Tax=Methylomagnum ishizawai TaxID=1760988 RepID=A0A1Y6D1Y2_9GAMM|nr:rhodanese-like domain-containing protein [Methylomagnum ishizawai]SMF96611.1 Rhodanese-related sulfurtransferase [Methylomagnum ishizawai]